MITVPVHDESGLRLSKKVAERRLFLCFNSLKVFIFLPGNGRSVRRRPFDTDERLTGGDLMLELRIKL